jgi:hypothetical protein
VSGQSVTINAWNVQWCQHDRLAAWFISLVTCTTRPPDRRKTKPRRRQTMPSIAARITWTLNRFGQIWRELAYAQRRMFEIMTDLDAADGRPATSRASGSAGATDSSGR